MNQNFEDCYCFYENNTFLMGNSLIEREIVFRDGNIPVSSYFKNKVTGYEWKASGQPAVFCNIPGFDFSQSSILADSSVDDNAGLSEKHLKAILSFSIGSQKIKMLFWIFPQNPFLSVSMTISGFERVQPISDRNAKVFDGNENKAVLDRNKEFALPPEETIDLLGISEKHLKIKQIELMDITDKNNSLVKEREDLLSPGFSYQMDGQMFLIDAYLSGEALMLVKEAPSAEGRCCGSAYDLCIEPGKSIRLFGTGVDFSQITPEEEIKLYYSSIGVGKATSLPRSYRKYYKNMCASIARQGTYSLSNTWGDRNQDCAVCDSFIRKEIAAAKQLSINVLQIDDGWQKGKTANSALTKNSLWGSGYYTADSEFWTPDPQKFPHGLHEIADLVHENGMQLGLWFSPDLENHYANWVQDVNTLLQLWRDYGVRIFKLDGIDLTSKKTEMNFIKMLQKTLAGSANEITFNFDITARKRWGYLFMKEIGNIFVENRYTDWANYYPHVTLRNLWSIANYIPTGKLQFELLNPKRNVSKYGGDILMPNTYEIDYLFAITMFANPLFWMELSNLEEQDKKILSAISKLYHKYAKQISESEITPIGSMPDGTSFTGFFAKQTEKSGFLLLFREYNHTDEYEYLLDELKGEANIQIIHTNAERFRITQTEAGVSVKTNKACSFAFASWQIK